MDFFDKLNKFNLPNDINNATAFLVGFATVCLCFIVYHWEGLFSSTFTHCYHCLRLDLSGNIQDEVDSERLQRAHSIVSFLACIGSFSVVLLLACRVLETRAAAIAILGDRLEVEPFIALSAAMVMTSFKSMLTMRSLKAVFAFTCICYVVKHICADWGSELHLQRSHLNLWRLVFAMLLPGSFAMPANTCVGMFSILCSIWRLPTSFEIIFSESSTLIGLLSVSFMAAHTDRSVARFTDQAVILHDKQVAEKANAQRLQEALCRLMTPQYSSILLLDQDMQIKTPSTQLASVFNLGDSSALDGKKFVDYIASDAEKGRFLEDCKRVSRECKKKRLGIKDKLASLRSSIATLGPTLNVYHLHTCFSLSDMPELYILGVRKEIAEEASSDEVEMGKSGSHEGALISGHDRRFSVDSALSDTISEITVASGLTLAYSDTTCKSTRSSRLSSHYNACTQTMPISAEDKGVQAGDNGERPPKLPGMIIPPRSKAPFSPRSTRSTSDTSYVSRRSGSPSRSGCGSGSGCGSSVTATSVESSELTYYEEIDDRCEFVLGGSDSHSNWDLQSDGTFLRGGSTPRGFIRLSEFMALPKDGKGQRSSFGSLDHVLTGSTKACVQCVFHRKAGSICRNGALCLFCHAEHFRPSRVARRPIPKAAVP